MRKKEQQLQPCCLVILLPLFILSTGRKRNERMHISLSATSSAAVVLAVVLLSRADAFSAPSSAFVRQPTGLVSLASVTEAAAMADSGVPPPTSEASDVAEEEIPTNLPSDVGMDYIPLATMLATGQLAEADQVRPRRRATFLLSLCIIYVHTYDHCLPVMFCCCS